MKILLFMLIYVCFWALFITGISFFLNERTSYLSNENLNYCIKYSKTNHMGEIGVERFNYLKQFGNPNDPKFFFESCIGRFTGQPASKKYLVP